MEVSKTTPEQENPKTETFDKEQDVSLERIRRKLAKKRTARVTSTGENADNSPAQLRRRTTGRTEESHSEILLEMMESILNTMALSIHLLKESKPPGSETPAEAANVETSCKDRGDLVEEATREHMGKDRQRPTKEPEDFQARAEQETRRPEVNLPEEPAKEAGAGNNGKTLDELQRILARLAARQEAIFQKHQETTADQRAVERTIRLLYKNS